MCGICFSIEPICDALGSSNEIPVQSHHGIDERTSNSSLDHEDTLPGQHPSEHPEVLALDSAAVWDSMTASIESRGPDFSHTHVVELVLYDGARARLRFHAAILHMRGEKVTQQPFISEEGDVFLWNGEVFDGLDVNIDQNDAKVLFDLIQKNGQVHVLSTLRNIEGPYAFIYYQASTSLIYFGRDPVGRRSLLLHQPTSHSKALYMSSCGLSLDHSLNEWEEVESHALYCWDLKEMDFSNPSPQIPKSFPRVFKSSDATGHAPIYPFDQLVTTLPTPSDLLESSPSITDPAAISRCSDDPVRPIHTPLFISTMDALLVELSASVATRVALSPRPRSSASAQNKARIAILFSGGLDCTTLALLTDAALIAGEEIDLINVGFENPRSLRGVDPLLLSRRKTKTTKLQRRLAKKVAMNGKDVEREEDHEVELSEVSTPASSILAENTRSIYDVPDRLTGLASLRELRALRPNRIWNFVEVNVTYKEMLEHRMKVLELMRPQKTVMDLSISIAFYFAARGQGTLYSAPTSPRAPPIPYTSTARILLSGLGADELLGGYSRHRKTFQYSPLPWSALITELQTDLDRISSRNLGRDDRIIAFHGKEARYPFLAANVIDLITRTPIWLKCDHRMGEGVGDKLLLREMVKREGLIGAAGLKKRAIHFGARTAKMEFGTAKARGEDDFVL